MLKLALNPIRAVRVGSLLNSLANRRTYTVEGLSLSVLNSLNVKKQLKKVKMNF
jgi:hypothetical protein